MNYRCLKVVFFIHWDKIMARIKTRTATDGTIRYTAEVRLKGYPHQTATFRRLSDAKKWALAIESKIRAARVKSLMESAS